MCSGGSEEVLPESLKVSSKAESILVMTKHFDVSRDLSP